jgi:glycosyltransferase involved in cell wall biosynthesis
LNKNSKPKTILICSNYAWTIFNFRLPVIRSIRNAGYRVEVLTQFDGYEERLRDEVDDIHNLYISRKGLNPFVDFITFLHISFILLRSKATACLFFTIKPVIYGSLASMFLRVPGISTITGLGTAFMSEGFLSRITTSLYKVSFLSVKGVFFQNIDDKNLFINKKLVNPNVCHLSPGSGVDLDKFKSCDLPKSDEMKFLLVARMLWDKGIGEFVEAARIVKHKYPNTHFQLLGPLGVDNRSAISNKDIEKWQKDGVIEYLGETDNVIKYINNACCIVLPSYREGTSRVLLESAAMGRPLIATNVPGCKEVIEDGISGYLCKSHNSDDLANKIEKMVLLSYSSRCAMGEKGRQKMEQEFNQDLVCKLYLGAIKGLKI